MGDLPSKSLFLCMASWVTLHTVTGFHKGKDLVNTFSGVKYAKFVIQTSCLNVSSTARIPQNVLSRILGIENRNHATPECSMNGE